jgi:hypothetical protein
MAKQRYVNTYFWDDPYVENLSPTEKLMFMYLITTPVTNIAGSYEITMKKMHDHTALSREEIAIILQKFEKDRKFIYRDNWMFAVNAVKHQNTNNGQIKAGIDTIIAASPAWVRDGSYMTLEESSHLNLNLNSNSNGDKRAETAVEDPVEKRIWKDGKDLLAKEGMSRDNAGSLLGRLASQYTKPLLAEAIAVTQAQNPANPKTFLMGVLKTRAKGAAAMQVGKNDQPTEQHTCKECFDTGTVLVKPRVAKFDWERINAPCPSCSVKEKAA